MQPLTLLTLPTDVLRLILAEQQLNDLNLILKLVCKRFKTLVNEKKTKIDFKACVLFCATHGYTNILAFLAGKFDKNLITKLDVCKESAKSGQVQTLQWARANGCPWNENTCAYAAENGHLEVLQWAVANGAPYDIITLGSPHVDVQKWIAQLK